ncbi:hypothetical protein HKX48_009546 [Thoreauomyces humboldtii]|nr:hypothetical protein HKX48_009546 [Thoreauomyces humboldtii]
MTQQSDFLNKASDLLARAQELLASVQQHQETIPNKQAPRRDGSADLKDGLAKFSAQVKAEERFLQKLVSDPASIRAPHLTASNIPYLAAVFKRVLKELDVTGVFRTFNYSQAPGASRNNGVRIDVVAANGRRWIKVKASALKGFAADLEEEDSDSSESESEVGNCLMSGEGMDKIPDIPIFAQARALVSAASQNQIHFVAPEIVMAFAIEEEIDSRILETLRSMGIIVQLRDDDARSGGEERSDYASTVNLDVTTLVALISDMTHVPDTIPLEALNLEPLRLQLTQEADSPFLPSCYEVLTGREVVTSRSALRKLIDIVKLLGGPREQERLRVLIRKGPLADDIMSELPPVLMNTQPPFGFGTVTVIPDAPSERFVRVFRGAGGGGAQASKKLQPHHLAVFGTGDSLRATTVSANAWLERALVDCGLGGTSLWTHPPRSLVELRVQRYLESSDASAKVK